MLTMLVAGVNSTQHDIERALSKAIELGSTGVAVTAADGQILLTNSELQRMFGYAGAELLGQPIERLMPERFRSGHASLRSGDCKDIPLSGAGRELCGRRADGTEFPIKIGLSVLETPEGPMVVETISDIAVRGRLEKLFQKMMEAAPGGMVIIDRSGRIALVNPQAEAMFGYARSELIGAPLEMLLPERFRATHGRHRRAFIASPATRAMGVGRDLSARRKDGSEFPVEIGLTPITGESGGLVLATVLDITRRKSLELELQQAHLQLEELTDATSHDLQGPLRGIADLVEWIEQDLGTFASPEIVRNLGRIGDRVRRLEQSIEDLLKYAHTGPTSAEAVAVDPRALLAEILQTQAVPPGFRVAVHIDAAPFVTIKTPLATALINLVANAVRRADPLGGNLEIRVEEVDRYCVFTVSDDGPGIPLPAQGRVFRVSQTLAPGGHGASGIGLALSKRLVEAHSGKITLSSTEGVRGASFRVWWPRFQR